jgi:hypothetical protein
MVSGCGESEGGRPANVGRLKVIYSEKGEHRYEFEYEGTDNTVVKIGMLFNLQERLIEELQFLGVDAARIANDVLNERRDKG